MPTNNVQGASKVFNTPNFSGMLYSATPIETPFLSLIGGMGGANARTTTNFEFPVGSLYDGETASQPDISEDASMTAPAPYTIVRSQEVNVTQTHQETVEVSYDKMANVGRLSGINTAGQQNNVNDELNFQIARKMEKIARDVEFSFLNGEFVKSDTSNVANKTRGMISASGTQKDAGSADLSYELIMDAMEEAWNNGATFTNFYFFTNGTQKRKLTAIFQELKGFVLPATRNVGGINITSFETDFGNVNIVLDKFMPKNTILGADLSVIVPVEQIVPGKGNFFLETLSKNGASERRQIYGKIGLDYGANFRHLVIKNLNAPTARATTRRASKES